MSLFFYWSVWTKEPEQRWEQTIDQGSETTNHPPGVMDLNWRRVAVGVHAPLGSLGREKDDGVQLKPLEELKYIKPRKYEVEA